jgi:hypothetical protein
MRVGVVMSISMLPMRAVFVNRCDWVNPGGRSVRTIYYQGVNSSQVQVAKYCGKRGFIATTGEHVVCDRAFDVIEHPFIGKELDEITLKYLPASKKDRLRSFLKHPIQALQQHINGLRENKLYAIRIKSAPHSSRLTVAGYSVTPSAMSLAQERDILEHKARYDLCVAQYPGDDIILYGVSRGAATTFNACACNGYDFQRVRLVVLEGCFDSIDGLMCRYPVLSGSEKLQLFAKMALMKFTKFDGRGVSPIDLIGQFPEGVPVIFITSESDRVVPKSCVQRLVTKLKKRGKNPLYMLVLKKSSHPRYMMDNKEDIENYRDCMHALYKAYNLPYIPLYADSGASKNILDACRVL